MEKLDKIKEVKVSEQQIEIDPRSKTSADKAYNYIGTGGPEEEVQGQGAVLAEKRLDFIKVVQKKHELVQQTVMALIPHRAIFTFMTLQVFPCG